MGTVTVQAEDSSVVVGENSTAVSVEVTEQAAGASVEVAKDAAVGTVANVTTSGDNTTVETEGTTGTTAGGETVSGGESTTTETTTPSTPAVPDYPIYVCSHSNAYERNCSTPMPVGCKKMYCPDCDTILSTTTCELDWTEPTCTEGEYGTCTVCGSNYPNEDKPALGHDYTYTPNYNGTHTYVCKNDETHTGTETCSASNCVCGDTTRYVASHSNGLKYTILQYALAVDGTVTLLSDVNLASEVPIATGTTVVLDLNGYAITSGYQENSDSKHISPINNSGTLTIKDSVGTGSITGRGVYNQNGATITVNGAKIIAEAWNGGAGIWSYGTGKVYLNNATIIGNTGVVSSEGYLEINGGTYTCYSGIAEDGTQLASPTYNIRAYNGLKITGGTFTNRHGVISVGGGTAVIEDGSYTILFNAKITSNVVYVYGDTDLTINGGSFISDDSANKADSGAAVLVSGSDARLKITGGTFVGMNSMVSGNANTKLEGGTYGAVWNYNHYGELETYVSEGYKVTQGEDSKWTVSALTEEDEGVVAKVGGLCYTSLADAIAAGGEVILVADIDLSAAVVVTKNVTLNLNGKTLTVTNNTAGDGVFHVTGGTLTINGEGTVNGVGKSAYCMAIWADGGNVVINGGAYTNVGANTDPGSTQYDLIYAKNDGTVTINGGTFNCQTPFWTLNKHDSTNGNIVVKGGTFVGYNPSESNTENPTANFVAEGYEAIKDETTNTWTVVAKTASEEG